MLIYQNKNSFIHPVQQPFKGDNEHVESIVPRKELTIMQKAQSVLMAKTKRQEGNQNIDKPKPGTTGKYGGKRYVVYENMVTYGGSAAWRNFNPGNIVKSDFATSHGAIGNDGKFAVFPDYNTGYKAIGPLLRTAKYNSLTIAAAISRYAPTSDSNDPVKYAKTIENKTGIKSSTIISTLDDAQLKKVVDIIVKVEGTIPGTIYTKGASDLPEWVQKIL